MSIYSSDDDGHSISNELEENVKLPVQKIRETVIKLQNDSFYSSSFESDTIEQT